MARENVSFVDLAVSKATLNLVYHIGAPAFNVRKAFFFKYMRMTISAVTWSFSIYFLLLLLLLVKTLIHDYDILRLVNLHESNRVALGGKIYLNRSKECMSSPSAVGTS